MKKKIAAIFPAFGCRYLGNELETLSRLSDNMDSLIYRAAELGNLDVINFLTRPDGNFIDELQSQYAVYIYGCAASNIIKLKGIRTDSAAGYSMGLYAALYHAEAFSFEQGLDLIMRAHHYMRDTAARVDCGMGAISGLDRDDILQLISRYGDIEIINVNSRHSFLIAGPRRGVSGVVSAAKEEGALNSKMLPFASPYHSRFMDAAAGLFGSYVDSIDMRDLSCPVLSTIDQREIVTANEAKTELANNVNININWLNTMTEMITAGTRTFIECGPGKSLSKMAKFIYGEFEIYTLPEVIDIISSKKICAQPAVSR